MFPNRQLRTRHEIIPAPVEVAVEIRACNGGETRCVQTLTQHMEQCQDCGITVPSGLIDHPCFGFEAACLPAEDE
jgi:hypothetical protein